MVNNEKYTKFLKSIIACVSHGDYSAAKELSHLELEKMKNDEKKSKKEIKKYKKFVREKDEEKEIAQVYAKYLLDKIITANTLEELQQQAITMDEFINQIQG